MPGYQIAGKTGTAQHARGAAPHAWFIGFDPDITLGVWIGLDQKKPIGRNQTGAEAALPQLGAVARAAAAMPSS